MDILTFVLDFIGFVLNYVDHEVVAHTQFYRTNLHSVSNKVSAIIFKFAEIMCVARRNISFIPKKFRLTHDVKL